SHRCLVSCLIVGRSRRSFLAIVAPVGLGRRVFPVHFPQPFVDQNVAFATIHQGQKEGALNSWKRPKAPPSTADKSGASMSPSSIKDIIMSSKSCSNLSCTTLMHMLTKDKPIMIKTEVANMQNKAAQANIQPKVTPMANETGTLYDWLRPVPDMKLMRAVL
uniref:Cytochrome oxidase subunit 1 n=1 Tax=Romanomermis culicivorax TaxID=13658 RepID=A0A915K0N1_ROMCU